MQEEPHPDQIPRERYSHDKRPPHSPRNAEPHSDHLPGERYSSDKRPPLSAHNADFPSQPYEPEKGGSEPAVSLPLSISLQRAAHSARVDAMPTPLSNRPRHWRRVGIVGSTSVLLVGILLGIILLGHQPHSSTHAQPQPTSSTTTLFRMQEFPIGYDRPTAIITGPDGNLWFTLNDSIGMMTPHGIFQKFAPAGFVVSYPGDITVGADHNLWFTDYSGNIEQVTPTGSPHVFPLPIVQKVNDVTVYNPLSITNGPDHNLWFTALPNQIDSITPRGVLHQFTIPTRNSTPTNNYLGPEGTPMGITLGADGNLWFTEGVANKIGVITPKGTVQEFRVPTADSDPASITLGPDGNLWFTEAAADKIGSITPQGVIHEFAIPTVIKNPMNIVDGPTDITKGPDGNLWFTDQKANIVGRLTTTGNVQEYPISTFASDPEGITAGSDGNIWFTEKQGGNIGCITLH